VLVLTTPLAGPTQATNPDRPPALTNPMLNFDHSLSLAAAIVIQEMNSSETAAGLGVTPGYTTTYVVSNGSSNPELLESGPFLFIWGTAPSPEEAQAITEQVVAKATAVLDERQTELDAPSSTHIGVEQVVAPSPGQLLSGTPLRAAAAALALGGVATLTVVYGFESLMSHRRRRKPAPAPREPEPDESATTSGDLLVGAAGR
jgi:hypothetical protein